MQFQWETEDAAEVRWDEESTPASSRRRRWPWLLSLTLILALVAASLTWLALRRRVAETTATLGQEVRAAHKLVSQAAAHDDLELFTTMLSGRDRAWTADQKLRLEAGLLLGETASVLGWKPVAPGTVQEVTFSPGLDEAMLVTEQAYTVAGYTGTIRLQQTHVYRRGEAHWLLSPPEPAFWGDRATAGEGAAHLTFRRRDQAFALALLREVEAYIPVACKQLPEGCGALPSVSITLDSAPGSVLLAERLPLRDDGAAEPILLPAPSLLGEPAGDKAREALLDSYTAIVIATTLNDVSGYRCCDGSLFQEALLAQEVKATGLPAWPPPREDYTTFVDNPLTADQLEAVWAGQTVPPVARRQAAAFVHFLLDESGLSSGELQHLLQKSGWVWPWLSRIGQAAPAWEWQGWESAWLQFLYRQANEAWGTPGAWPSEDLHLACRDESGQIGLYRYEVHEQRWHELLSLAGSYPALVPAPADQGVFLFDLSPREITGLGTIWWRAGDTLAFDVPGADVVWRPSFPASEDPQGQYATMLRVTTDEPIPEGVSLLDLASCDRSGCAWRHLPGQPLWSPDGEQLLVQTVGGEWLRGARETTSWEPVPVGRAGQAFWTYGGKIGFVSPDRQQLTIPAANSAARTIPVSSLLAHLPEGGRPGRWRVAAVVPVLAQEKALLVALARAATETEQLFLVSADGTRITWLLGLEDGALAWLWQQALSPDRRWLALFPFGGPQEGPRFLLYDLQKREVVIDSRGAYYPGFRAFDWGREGQWLARLGQQVVELAAPAGAGTERPFRHFVSTAGLRCSSVAWARSEGP